MASVSAPIHPKDLGPRLESSRCLMTPWRFDSAVARAVALLATVDATTATTLTVW
jgi:hypothetical protein